MLGTIEEMQEADYQQVATLWEAVGFWPHPGEDRLWFARALARNPGGALVWRQNGEIIGTVIAGWDGLRGWIYRLGRAPDPAG